LLRAVVADGGAGFEADLGELADWSGILVIAARADSTNVAMINRPIIDSSESGSPVRV